MIDVYKRQMKKYQRDMLDYFDSAYPEIGREIEEKRQLPDELAEKMCIRDSDTPWALHKEVHISCIAKRVAGKGVNSNLFMRAAIENRVI